MSSQGRQQEGVRGRRVVVWKLLEYLGLVLFLVVAPRLMGPQRYGEFAVLLAWVSFLTLAGGLGALAIFGRFVPEYAAVDERRPRELFTQVFVVRAIVGAVLAALAMIAVRRALPTAGATLATSGAGAVLAAVLAASCYQLYFGLNRLDRWLSRRALQRPLLVSLLAAFGAWRSLEAAGWALVSTELLLLALGLYWTRHEFVWSPGVLGGKSIRRHFGFGLRFFVANLCAMAVWRGGEIVLSLAGTDSAEIAQFSLAVAGVGLAAAMLMELTMLLVPTGTALRLSGREEEQEILAGRGLRVLCLIAWAMATTLQLGGAMLAEWILGSAYATVSTHLALMVVVLIPVVLVRAAVAIALIEDRPRSAVVVTGTGLVVFVLVSWWLAPRLGASGVTIALVAALAAGALSALSDSSMWRVAGRAGLVWIATAALVALLVQWRLAGATLWLRAMPSVAFVVLSLVFGWFDREDYRELMSAVGRRLGKAPAGDASGH